MSIEIPKKIETEIYVHIGVGTYNLNSIHVRDFSATASRPIEGFEHLDLFKFPLSIDVPEGITVSEITSSLVKILEAKKDKIRGEYSVKIQRVQDEIDSFLALEHNPEDSNHE